MVYTVYRCGIVAPQFNLHKHKNLDILEMDLVYSEVGTRYRLYALEPTICATTTEPATCTEETKTSSAQPPEPVRSARVAYQRIITAFARGRGHSKRGQVHVNISVQDDGNAMEWAPKDRDRLQLEMKRSESAAAPSMNEFMKQNLEENAAFNWDKFYIRHRKNFFKDRHYMSDEFIELKTVRLSGHAATILEAGCGVGNSVFPLLEEIPSLKVFAADFAGTAIQLLRSSEPYLKYGGKRCHAFVCDLSSTDGEYALVHNIMPSSSRAPHPYIVNKVEYVPCAPEWGPAEGVDLAMMMFCLSAVSPEKMKQAVSNVAKVMRPGGVLWFRDYAEADHAQMRFKNESRISHKFYVRGDGTRSYFFGLAEIDSLMSSCGLLPLGDTKLIERVVKNRKKDEAMHRAWVHGRFQKILP